MRHSLFAACVSLSLGACGGTTLPEPTGDEATQVLAPDLPADVRSALAALPSARIIGAHEDGMPFMIRGDFGRASGSVREPLAAIAPVFRLRASDLVVRRSSRDERGHTHVRYSRTLNGLPVFGEELIVHLDELGRIYAANGSARGGEAVALPAQARLSREALEHAALALVPGGERVWGEPRLQYARSSTDSRLKLAYELVVEDASGGGRVREHVFIDALEGTLVLRFSDHHEAVDRVIYSRANSGNVLVRQEGEVPTGDAIVDVAYDNLGRFYDCYQSLFSRDSYDNAGAPLQASVHFLRNYGNAYWNGYSQIMCGDGDSSISAPCSDPDIIFHEMTHAVTGAESGLVYTGESGGLNESMSDIAAVFCSSWETGWSTGPDIWKLAESSWTPATAGDALRYLDDPRKDGRSLDYYPDYTSSTSVHYSSGISNLAFALLSKGGLHPRGKTSVTVAGIGVEQAARIFYKAGTDYFTASTTFAQARAYTEQAAQDLSYSTGSVTAAWEAVGVGLTPPPALAAGGAPRSR
ncbi:hypothetical protein CYFUS_003038 [Cystobacter fuscus]|uniref:Neutral metalloproteinase n=1 Tax=Cystobacter fuscus TaxID=43 RepID=A0A250J219_9BACT|nr:M4 family metallopeptidase [Cystobacter fuscus]ATB37613.1 hypothetical protein CYFUS_003038 [Cystobacter fuscus]